MDTYLTSEGFRKTSSTVLHGPQSVRRPDLRWDIDKKNTTMVSYYQFRVDSQGNPWNSAIFSGLSFFWPLVWGPRNRDQSHYGKLKEGISQKGKEGEMTVITIK